MNKQLIESIKLVPKFSHEFNRDYIMGENGRLIHILRLSRYETNLNFIDKSQKYPGSLGKNIISYNYDCTNNNKRDVSGYYYSTLFKELKIINKLLKYCPDFDEQIRKNKGKYFFDFKLIDYSF